jgi:hypothetical protein
MEGQRNMIFCTNALILRAQCLEFIVVILQ